MTDLGRQLNAYRQAVARANMGAGGLRVSIIDDSPSGASGFDRLFVGLGATLDELPKALTDAEPAIRAAFNRNFNDQSGRSRWAPLAPRTIAERRRLGFGAGPIQTRTGALRRHVTAAPARVTRVGDAVELRIKPARFVGSTGASYQLLAMGGRGIPSRPMVVVRPDDANRITSAISRSLRARARANGLG